MADWSSETNWTVASGSLLNSLTFQSSLSLFDDDDDANEVNELHSNSPPLFLHSPSPHSDSAPCEININFKGKHELDKFMFKARLECMRFTMHPTMSISVQFAALLLLEMVNFFVFKLPILHITKILKIKMTGLKSNFLIHQNLSGTF